MTNITHLTADEPELLSSPLIIILLALFATSLWFGILGSRVLLNTDEGRYAEIPREMALSGDFVTPRLNGFKYFEKPPLQYWATAIAFKIWGEGEWTARLWTALTSFFALLLAAYTGARLWGLQAGIAASTTLASSLFFVLFGELITLDMGFSVFLFASLCGLILANHQRDTTPKRSDKVWMRFAWAALALAVLSKGLAALVLGGAILLLYSILTRDYEIWRRMEWRWGLAIFILIAAPWFVLVSWRNPEFAWFFFVHEHFVRFLSTVHRRYQPFYAFVPVFLLCALPWTSLWLHAWAGAWRREQQRSVNDNNSDARNISAFRPLFFLSLWALLVFVFFSASSSKLPPYILPMAPALALLAGYCYRHFSRRAWCIHYGLTLLALLACLAATPLIMSGADAEMPVPMMTEFMHGIQLALLILSLTAGAALLIAWRGQRLLTSWRGVAWLCMVSGSMIGLKVGIHAYDNAFSDSRSTKGLVERARPHMPVGAPMYTLSFYEQTLPFYLQQLPILVDIKSEMSFGIEHEPGLQGHRWLADEAAFASAWAKRKPAFAFMEIQKFEQLKKVGFPMRELARNPRYVIVGQLDQ